MCREYGVVSALSKPEKSTALAKHDPRVASVNLPGFEGLVYVKDTVATLEKENKDLRERLARLETWAEYLKSLTVENCGIDLKPRPLTQCPTFIKARDCQGCLERNMILSRVLWAGPLRSP